MARLRGFQRQSPQRSRRQTAWALGPNAVQVSLTASGSAIWTNGAVTSLAKVTIVRIRGNAGVHITATSGANDGFKGAFGIGVVAENAFSVGGITSLPTPLTDNDWDGWMVHQSFDVRSITGTIADGSNAARIQHQYEIDSKSMRKFGDEQVVFGAIQVVETGASSLVFDAETRMLVMLG